MKKEQLITRTVSNMENEDTAEDPFQKIEEESRLMASRLSTKNCTRSQGNSKTFA